jgi:hypothetical protein
LYPGSGETLIADPRVLYGGNSLAKDVQIKKELELEGSFKEMARKGIKFTSYEVRDGAGRPISD